MIETSITAPRSTFVAVDGIDGSGKGGVVGHLVDHLTSAGVPVVGTREPGGTPEGEKLRALLLSGPDESWHPFSELLLMTAARVQHVQRVILPALAAGKTVVSDRFVASTIAYQGAGRGISERFIRQLHAEAVGDIWPDLTIILDLDASIGLSRSRHRLIADAIDEGRFENIELDFHERVRQSYLDQAKLAPSRYAVIDASGTPEEVKQAAVLVLADFLVSRQTTSF